MSEREKGTCGACIAFLVDGLDGEDAAGPRGRCHLRRELGAISHTLPRCARYIERGTGARYVPPKVARPRGASLRERDDTEVVVERPKAYGPTIDLGDDMDSAALKALIRDVLVEEGVLGETAMGKRWQGGVMILKPGVDDQQPKEVPLEAFFHKVVMLRDRLRVLEQKINGNDKLSDQDKVELQQYVTRCYGSLTTFNVLFRDKEDHFVGAKGE